MLAFACCLSVLPPALVKIAPEFRLRTADIARLSGAELCPLIAMVAIGGLLARRIPKGAITAWGCWIMVLGSVVLALAKSYWALLAGVVLLGTGAGLIEATAAALVSDMFDGSRRTKALNYTQVSFAAGAIGIPLGMAALIRSGWDWRLGFWCAAGIAVVSGIWLAVTHTVRAGKTMPAGVSTHSGLDRFVLLLVVAMFCYVGTEVAVCFWMPTYFSDILHAGDAFAAASNSVFWVGVILGRLAAGHLSRIIPDIVLLRVSAIGGFSALVVFTLAQSPLAGIIIAGWAGLMFACIWPTILSYTGHIYGERFTLVYPWVVGAGAAGATAGPMMAGSAAAAFGHKAAFWINPTMFLVIAVVVLLAPLVVRWARVNTKEMATVNECRV